MLTNHFCINEIVFFKNGDSEDMKHGVVVNRF
jgi:hypothetical protein